MLVDGFIAKHRAMIKEMRGLPGVIPERLMEADTVSLFSFSFFFVRFAFSFFFGSFFSFLFFFSVFLSVFFSLLSERSHETDAVRTGYIPPLCDAPIARIRV